MYKILFYFSFLFIFFLGWVFWSIHTTFHPDLTTKLNGGQWLMSFKTMGCKKTKLKVMGSNLIFAHRYGAYYDISPINHIHVVEIFDLCNSENQVYLKTNSDTTQTSRNSFSSSGVIIAIDSAHLLATESCCLQFSTSFLPWQEANSSGQFYKSKILHNLQSGPVSEYISPYSLGRMWDIRFLIDRTASWSRPLYLNQFFDGLASYYQDVKWYHITNTSTRHQIFHVL